MSLGLLPSSIGMPDISFGIPATSLDHSVTALILLMQRAGMLRRFRGVLLPNN